MASTSSPRASAGPHSIRRALGLAGVAVVFVFYRPDAAFSVLNGVILPLIGLVAAWMVLRSALAIALAGMLLALAHSDLDAGNARQAWVYPVIAAASAAVLIGVLARRFVRSMHATREARRARHSGAPR